MKRYLIATRSEGKIREIKQIFAHSGIRLITLDEIGCPQSPEEDEIESFATFRENAIAKASYFAELTGIPAIADDSGIAVDVLGGAPGVRSKRFADEADLEREALDAANNRRLLESLDGIPMQERAAHYACAAALATPERAALTAIGTCSGFIAEEPRGEDGFGYDPLFILPEIGRTFAEIGPHEKNRYSHRARAFYALRAHLDYFVTSPR